MNKEQYKLVVQTDCWKLRIETYLKNNPWCEVCGNAEPGLPLQVNHLTYARIGEERDSDLVAVCRSCHLLLHRLAGRTSLKIVFGNLPFQKPTPKRNLLLERIKELGEVPWP